MWITQTSEYMAYISIPRKYLLNHNVALMYVIDIFWERNLVYTLVAGL